MGEKEAKRDGNRQPCIMGSFFFALLRHVKSLYEGGSLLRDPFFFFFSLVRAGQIDPKIDSWNFWLLSLFVFFFFLSGLGKRERESKKYSGNGCELSRIVPRLESGAKNTDGNPSAVSAQKIFLRTKEKKKNTRRLSLDLAQRATIGGWELCAQENVKTRERERTHFKLCFELCLSIENGLTVGIFMDWNEN